MSDAIKGQVSGGQKYDFEFYHNIGGGMPSPGEVPRTTIVGDIANTPTQFVTINGGASAGSRHIDDSSPTEAETLSEQIVWQWDADDNIRAIMAKLHVPRLIPTGAGTTGEVSAHEVELMKFAIGVGDAAEGATNLTAETGIQTLPPNEWAYWTVDSAVTMVCAIAALTKATNAIQGGARIEVLGVKYE